MLYIPGGWDRECIALTDDLQLPSNHKVIIEGQNNYDIYYL